MAKFSKPLIAAAALLSSASSFADGLWNCSSVSWQSGAVTAESCFGSFDPPPANLAIMQSYYPSVGLTTFVKDDDAGALSTTPLINFQGNGNGAGSVTFNVSLTDSFVLEIKFGEEWSIYEFNDDVVAGTTWTFSGGPAEGGGLSHGSIGTVQAVPEPETYALMLAGLGAVGFIARRRKAAAAAPRAA